MKTERDLQNYLKMSARARGVLFHKLESRSARGFPDVMLMYAGGVIFVELKSPGGSGRLSGMQRLCHRQLRDHGGVVWVVDSVERADDVISEVVCMQLDVV